MKKLTIILFENDLENEKYSNQVLEKLSNLSDDKEFCGIWGEILFNNVECLSAISGCVNHFINNTDKMEIIFGCSRKDYDSILANIDTAVCDVNTFSCQNFEL